MQVTLDRVWYNPAIDGFEGRVDVNREGLTFRYPCTVSGPPDMPQEALVQQMIRQAKRMSDSVH